MAYPISVMIGIRTGGVFDGETDMRALKRVIERVRKKLDKDEPYEHPQSFRFSVSKELKAGKGSMVIIAGIFNYWNWERVSRYAAALSRECGTEVMAMTHDLSTDGIDSNVFLDGKPLMECNENPMMRIMRRIGV